MNYTPVLPAWTFSLTCVDGMVDLTGMPGRRKQWVTGCHTHPSVGLPLPVAGLR